MNEISNNKPKPKPTKTVLITGCSSGFGRELVSAFLQRGWCVIATLRQATERESLFSEEQQAYGERLIVKNFDVTSDKDRADIVEVVDTLAGSRLDCVINNAGYALHGALENCSEQQIRDQYEVNLIAPTLLIRAMLPYLRAAQGTVINVSSLMGYMGFPLSSTYCASKAGLTLLSEALWHELSPFGVRVYAVEPGGFRTGFVSNSQWGDIKRGDIYQMQEQGLQGLQDKLSQGEGRKPTPVIQRVVALAEGRKSTVRHPVGSDARIAKIVQKCLPELVQTKLMGALFKKISGSR